MFSIYHHSPANSWPSSAVAMLVLLGAAPAVILYKWLAYLVNRATIRLGAARVSVRHGPLPWPGTRDVLKSEIARVFSERRTYSSSLSSDGTAFEPKVTYAVKLMLKDGKALKLVGGLLAPEQAMFIEQQIRRDTITG